jgi:hypothetical protein
MKYVKWLFCAFILIALLGCDNGTTNNSSSNNNPPPPPPPPAKEIDPAIRSNNAWARINWTYDYQYVTGQDYIFFYKNEVVRANGSWKITERIPAYSKDGKVLYLNDDSVIFDNVSFVNGSKYEYRLSLGPTSPQTWIVNIKSLQNDANNKKIINVIPYDDDYKISVYDISYFSY